MPEEVFTQCTCGGVHLVHVKDGKIIRIRPLVFDETDAPSWTIEARGKKFTPPRKTAVNHCHAAERSRIYSEERIKYPYKRVDFDPNSKNRKTENRGKSGYVRISWDEALDIEVNEIKRIRKTYGPAAITACTSSHHNWGLLSYKTGPMARFFRTLGYTEVWDNPDSWEGAHWGAVHAYGNFRGLGWPPGAGLQDVLQNTEMIIMWSGDPYSTVLYAASDAIIRQLWIRDVGIKRVFIDPWCNYTASLIGDKWIAPRPGTDAAMAEAIAYVWLKDDTYDKFFVENRTLGFEEFKAQTLGKKDGTPRTPGWAAEISGVPAHDIVALAREWAKKRTMFNIMGGHCRQAYGTEVVRLLVYLQAMQGWGKPGVNFMGMGMGVPTDPTFTMAGYNDGWWDMFSIVADKRSENKVTQKIYRLLIPDVILNPPVHWHGEGFCWKSIEQQFKPYTCPEAGSNGAPIKMLHRHGSSFISTMTDTNKWVRMYQSPNLEFAVNQDCWWGSETKFADLILPACTNFERSDISEWGSANGYGRSFMGGGGNHRVIVYQKKCIEPLHESRPDWDIYCDLAKRLGILEEYTEGRSWEDWIKKVFNAYSISSRMSYEEFKKKGYYVVPLPKGYDPKGPAPITYSWFYEGRPCDDPLTVEPANPQKPESLATFSGKVEFVSQSLKQYFPDDEERPPLARYIPSWEGYDSELTKKYPLQLITPHLKFSFHTSQDDTASWINEIPVHRVLKDGYTWWPIRMHPSDAEARDIRHGDIIKMYNDRAAVLGIAVVTERVKPGVIHSYQAARRYDPLEPGKAGSPDRGACTNSLSPGRMLSKNADGMANLSCLVEIAKWDV